MPRFEFIPTLITRILNYPLIKSIVALFLVLFQFMFDKANQEAMIALFALLIVDAVTALVASYKSGKEITSRKFFGSAIKFVVYFTMVGAAFLTEKAGITFVPLDETVIAFLAVTELISILENFSILGYVIPKKLLNKLRSYQDEK